MKIILTGATGYIGTEILTQSLKHKWIEHAYCIVRRPLDPKFSSHPKITELLHDNFSQYPASLLEYLKSEDVDGCIWCLGSNKHPDPKRKDEEDKVGISYPVTAAEAFAAYLATALSPGFRPRKKFPFRFVYMSAWGAEQNQFRSLWMWNDWRKQKGAAEKALFDVADNSKEIKGQKCFEVIALRPGQVIRPGDAIGTILWEATVPSIAVDRLAATALKTVMEGTGYPDKRIMENKDCLGSDWAMVNSLTI